MNIMKPLFWFHLSTSLADILACLFSQYFPDLVQLSIQFEKLRLFYLLKLGTYILHS